MTTRVSAPPVIGARPEAATPTIVRCHISEMLTSDGSNLFPLHCLKLKTGRGPSRTPSFRSRGSAAGGQELPGPNPPTGLHTCTKGATRVALHRVGPMGVQALWTLYWIVRGITAVLLYRLTRREQASKQRDNRTAARGVGGTRSLSARFGAGACAASGSSGPQGACVAVFH